MFFNSFFRYFLYLTGTKFILAPFYQINKKGEYNFKLIGDPILVDKNAFPFKKDADSAMIKAVNKAIKEMQKDGTMSKLSMKYFKRDISKEQITE